MKDYTQDAYTSQTQEPPVTYAVGGLGNVVTGANILVTGILMWGIYHDNGSTAVAVLSGVGYFSLSTTMALLTLSGSLTHIVTNGQNQKTIQKRDAQQYAVQMAYVTPALVEHPQLANTPSARPMAALQGANFVPAHVEPDDSARREAAAWLLQLYAQDGSPDPKKVLMKSEKERPGRIRVAAPSVPAKKWLMDKSILHDLGNGFRLNLRRCPTIAEAQEQLSTHPVPPGTPTHPPLPTPQLHEYESGAA